MTHRNQSHQAPETAGRRHFTRRDALKTTALAVPGIWIGITTVEQHHLPTVAVGFQKTLQIVLGAARLCEHESLTVGPHLLHLGEDHIVRTSAVYALDRIGGEQSVKPLIKALKDPYWEVRSDAASALGKIGDKNAVVPLMEALKDENSFVRKSASRALEKFEIFKK